MLARRVGTPVRRGHVPLTERACRRVRVAGGHGWVTRGQAGTHGSLDRGWLERGWAGVPIEKAGGQALARVF